MFTGLIEEVGTITSLKPQKESVEVQVQCRDTIRGAASGDSIAVDGICLTITHFGSAGFSTFASAETLRCTNLVYKQVGGRVNLERPLTLEKRLGGHLVQGHVDGIGRIDTVKMEGDSQVWRFSVSPDLGKYLVPKGSVAVDGISLTVVEAGIDYFTVALIPKTLTATTFQFRKLGDIVNVETDLLGKYVYKFLHPDARNATPPRDSSSLVVSILNERLNG